MEPEINKQAINRQAINKQTINKQVLEHCLSEYENLQAKHIDIIQKEPMPDLAAMTQERDKAFIRLKQNLDRFVKTTGSNERAGSIPDLAEYETKIASIMDASHQLSRVIQEYKDKLTAELAKIQHNKAAMHGYKTANMNY